MKCIVAAHKKEVLFLINHFKLKKIQGKTLFPVYRNDTIYLVLSGTGVIQAAAATSYLLHFVKEISLLLNIGCAGHPSHQIGRGFFIEKILYAKTYYPSTTISSFCDYETLITSHQIETSYPSQSLYDMEGAAFYEIASKILTNELIFLYKVVSDNSDTPFDKNLFPDLMTPHLPVILDLFQKVDSLEQITLPKKSFLEKIPEKKLQEIESLSTCKQIEMHKMIRSYFLLTNKPLPDDLETLKEILQNSKLPVFSNKSETGR